MDIATLVSLAWLYQSFFMCHVLLSSLPLPVPSLPKLPGHVFVDRHFRLQFIAARLLRNFVVQLR